jgi:copper chaperone CopZ
MVTEKITINGMHCDACEKTITRTFQKQGIAVKRISHGTGTATITHATSKKQIASLLSQKGYSLSGESSSGGKNDFAFEKQILLRGVATLVVLVLIQLALLLLIYPKLQGYAPHHFIVLLYMPLAIGLNMIALWHQRAYQRDVSCMTGMMVGMAIGMTTGFMVGALVGLTNGMFTGAVVGTIIGCAAGWYAGRCCGIMGMMEGLMAGLMSGTMGAMLTVMMVIDHVLWFIPFLFIICAMILIGTMRIVYDEHAGADVRVRPWSFAAVLGLSVLLMIVLSLVMVIAPKGIY